MKLYIIFIATFALFAQTAKAATVQIDPLSNTINLGETFTIDIIGTDFPITQGGGFNLRYDANILHATNVAIDEIDTWTFVNDHGTIDNENGVLNDVIVSDFPGITGDFTVATIEFLAVSLGTATLDLTESNINPWASDGTIISPSMLSNTSVQVVPIPPALWLLGSGLLSLLVISRKQSSSTI